MRSGWLFRPPRRCPPGGDVVAELGGDGDALSTGSECIAYELFTRERAIGRGSVEERGAAFDCGPDDGDHLLLRAGRSVARAHPHVAEAERGPFQAALSGCSLLHVGRHRGPPDRLPGSPRLQSRMAAGRRAQRQARRVVAFPAADLARARIGLAGTFTVRPCLRYWYHGLLRRRYDDARRCWYDPPRDACARRRPIEEAGSGADGGGRQDRTRELSPAGRSGRACRADRPGFAPRRDG